MEQLSFKYVREDFPPLSVRLHSMKLYINFLHDFVEVTNILDVTAEKEMDSVELDAKELEIIDVSWEQEPLGHGASKINFEYERDRNKLIIIPESRIAQGSRFKIKTVTRCVPSDHVLEGIYKDVTPDGAPQQYMSQCQQWGFQRIAPVFDDCRAKCLMYTTLEADSRYKRLVSNGAIDLTTNPAGKPILKPGDPSRQYISYRNEIPMAPYLFLVCAGTWDELVDNVTYDSGKTVRLEYLVPPGRIDNAEIPMQILKESVLWISKTQGYEYTSDVYRTICMTKSNFGGMENVGNTTIVTDAALIDEHTLDSSLVYAYAVIVHEFEHNQCGSETTMETPFDVWLNEAYTVDVERRFLQDVFDPSFIRLSQVDSIRSPLLGPLAIEDTGKAGIIVRPGFNDPDDLIDSVTYVKAAEVIRMLRLLVGATGFLRGKELYFARYKDSNANTNQFFECFEEVSGQDLGRFKECWLYRIGYPKVEFDTSYDSSSGRYVLALSQEQNDAENAPFVAPVVVALIDNEGKTVPGTNRIVKMDSRKAEVVFENISPEPAFASVNRDYSFYGTCRGKNQDTNKLILQTRLDNNLFNRIEAFRSLTDLQRVKLLTDPDCEIDGAWLNLFGEILIDTSPASSVKSFLLRIDEQPLDRDYSSWRLELVHAKDRLLKTVNQGFRSDLAHQFQSLDTYKPKSSPRDGIEDRILKQILLEMISIDDSGDSHVLIRNHFSASTTATDRVGALIAINRSSMDERLAVMEETYTKWNGHVSAYANYLRIISSGWKDDVFEMIEKERNRPTFDITNPTLSRALLMTMAGNSKKIWSPTGVEWASRTVVELASINTYIASKLLNVFQDFKRMRPNLKPLVQDALQSVVDQVPDHVSPTVSRQARSYLE